MYSGLYTHSDQDYSVIVVSNIVPNDYGRGWSDGYYACYKNFM